MPGIDCTAIFLLVVIQRTCGSVGFGINARRSYACTGGMLAIACCCTVSCVPCCGAAMGIMLSYGNIVRLCMQGLACQLCSKLVQCAGLEIILGACPMLDDGIYRDVY